MTSFVLDSSTTLSWFMPNETGSLDLLKKTVKEGAIVPTIWLLEIGNVLLCAERAKRITVTQRKQAMYILKDIPIKVDQTRLEHAWFETMELAEYHGLTLYDASYLELALHYNLPLATSDNLLKRAGQARGIVII
ncbi:MAG: type II toxin-antitoxin system VapC family toxin (plasmid) [Rickettsia endosymbiont of Sergentomyia squamirostris]|uniref:Type II toxin-antitoxin system VapC family toxin n=1 Tax=Candidatus Tisiphia endosymbiont of Sergentomyia squamirostris TaxID=3113639 RepID=A0AAT9GAQ1_9RICK